MLYLCTGALDAATSIKLPLGAFMPIREVTFRRGGYIRSRLGGDADALDFPVELDAGLFLHPPAHRFAQRLDVGRRGPAEIDQEVAVHFRHLGVADFQPAAAGGVYQ